MSGLGGLGGRRGAAPARWARAVAAAWRAHPVVVDALLALLLAAVSLGTLAYARDRCGCENAATGVVLVLLTTLPLAWRRAHPVAAGLVVGVAAIAYGLADLPNLVTPAPAGSLVALYTAAARCHRRVSVPVAAGSAVAVAVGLALDASSDWLDWAFVYLTLGTAWILGDSVRTHRAYAAALEERAVRLERERELEGRQRVTAERARIARELHDVVAHHLSMIVVQAEAGPILAQRDPARAVVAFDIVSATGRQALGELRRLLGVLRTEERPGRDGDVGGLAPQPGLADLPELVAAVRRAGLPADLAVEGAPRPLPAGVELTAYRIVQEALTNALRHAGSVPTRVRVRHGPDALDLRVTDDGPLQAGPPRPGGHGLAGMRERAALFGGTVDAVPGERGGFTVAARLPVAPADRPPTVQELSR